MKVTLKNKNFRFLMLGHICSFGASNILQFIISLYILEVTNSALAFSASLAVVYIAQIVTLPIAGVIGDRVDRKRMIVTLDFVNSLLIIGIAMLVFTNITIPILAVYVVIALLEIIEILYNSTMHGVIPLTLADDELYDGNNLKESVDTVIGLAAPMIATLLFATLQLSYILVIIGLLYFMCGLMEMLIKLVTPKREAKSECGLVKSFVDDFLEGIMYIKHDGVVKNVLAIGVTLNFFVAALILGSMYFIINEVLKLDDFYIATYQVVQSIIILMGLTLVAPRIKELRFKKVTLNILSVITGLLFVLLLITFNYVSGNVNNKIAFGFIVTFSSLAFMLLVVFSVRFNTVIQKSVDEKLISRVRSSMHIIYVFVMPLGMFLVGLMLDGIGVFYTLLIYTVLFLISSIILSLKINDLQI